MEKVYSRSKGCRKQMEHGHTAGLLKKANIKAHKEVSNVIDIRDEYSLEMKGTGMKKLAEIKSSKESSKIFFMPTKSGPVNISYNFIFLRNQFNLNILS